MAYLTERQISKLSDEGLAGRTIRIERASSIHTYSLYRLIGHGMKGVVWHAKDDLGNDVAVKLVPAVDYSNRSVLDEISQAMKIEDDGFAQVLFFGTASIDSFDLEGSYVCIATEWVNGETIARFLDLSDITVLDFLSLARQLFSVVAALEHHSLCHDDLHPGNILLIRTLVPLTQESVLAVKVIDTGTIKRLDTRSALLSELRSRVAIIKERNPESDEAKNLSLLLSWKEPDDHLRIVESLLLCANNLMRSYFRLDAAERKFVDQLPKFFQSLTDSDLERRLDVPRHALEQLHVMHRSALSQPEQEFRLASPFDYISSEMIQNEREFSELFSLECPWLSDCEVLEPLYIYGPRGCGKSSVLRWLSFKTALSDPQRNLKHLQEVGVYISCSVELRSRFWLLPPATIQDMQTPIIRFFVLILLEELMDTLLLMSRKDLLKGGDDSSFVRWFLKRTRSGGEEPRLQGQSPLSFLKSYVRKQRWATWSDIQSEEPTSGLPDPAVISDVCRELPNFFPYFESRPITFLIDDYSNQRIPRELQIKLNQTISFAKQGTPLFKVSSEFGGVDLEGIEEGREVVEINIGGKYISSISGASSETRFLENIIDIRLDKSGCGTTARALFGVSDYENGNMSRALASETKSSPFYYHGIDTIGALCSGDVALALDLVRRIFEENGITTANVASVGSLGTAAQHSTIKQFSSEEVRRVKFMVPHGDRMFEIVNYLGQVAHLVVRRGRSFRKDRLGEPICKTHIDIKLGCLSDLERDKEELASIYRMLTSRAVLVSLKTSRTRLVDSTERLQMRRIFFPHFMAPLKRDVPIKIDDLEELASLLSNPRSFAERELKRSGVEPKNYLRAYDIDPGQHVFEFVNSNPNED